MPRMPIPARIIRRQCDDLPGQRPHASWKDQDRQTRILDGAQSIMATYGRAAIGLTAFALGMRMAPATIRRAFPDMDYLLAEILRRHLRAIVAALAEIPRDAPNRDQARRSAYLSVTRTPSAPPPRRISSSSATATSSPPTRPPRSRPCAPPSATSSPAPTPSPPWPCWTRPSSPKPKSKPR